MIILAGSIRIGAGKREASRAAIDTMVAATRAEPGCVAYTFAWDVGDDHKLHIFEVFADDAALAAHRSSAHMASWRARASELGLGDRDMSEYVVNAARKL